MEYSKEIQTSEGSFDTPQKSEEEIRKEIMDEIEMLEKERQAELEEERKRAELEKVEEFQGNTATYTYIIKLTIETKGLYMILKCIIVV